MIGCEGSEGLKYDPYGKWHDFYGTSGEFSPTGGLKANRPGAKYGGMVVDLRHVKKDLVPKLEELEKKMNEALDKGEETTIKALVGKQAGKFGEL